MSITYNGNAQVKRGGVPHEFTKHEVLEYTRCMNDIDYFAENYVQVISLDHGLVPFKLRGYQKDLLTHYDDNRFSIVLAPRQSGKSIVSVAWLLHFIVFNADKKVAILANKGSTAREMLARFTLMLENLPFFLQPGVETLNKGNIVFSHRSEIIAAATSSSSIRGLALHCVVGESKVCILDNNEQIWYTEISNCINNGELIEQDMATKKYYTVYKITNKLNSKIYVGYHGTNNIDDGYMGSGKNIKRAIEKYGIDAFEKEILSIHDTPEDALFAERNIVDTDFILDPNTYNITLGGNVCILNGADNGFYGKTHTPETQAKISEKGKGRVPANCLSIVADDGTRYDNIKNVIETWDKVNELCPSAARARVLFECGDPDGIFQYEDVSKQNQAKEYYDNTLRDRETADDRKEEWKKNISNALKGKPKSEEHAKNISLGLTGKPKSKEHIDKINKNPEKIAKTAEKNRGQKRSAESRRKMSEAKAGMVAPSRGKRYYRNPNNPDEKGYFPIGEEPLGWLRGTGKRV